MKTFVRACILALFPAISLGKFALPTPIPVERLATKAEAYVQGHPEDPMGYYTLGRIHYAAFIYRSTVLGSFKHRPEDPNRPPDLPKMMLYQPNYPLLAEARRRILEAKGLKEPVREDSEFRNAVSEKVNELEAAGWKAPEMTPADLLKHFIAAKNAFDKASAMKPDDALIALGKASLWAQFSTPKLHQPLEKEPDVPAAMNASDLAGLYYRAYSLAKASDAMIQRFPIGGLNDIVSYEAGTNYLKLAPKGEHAEEVNGFLTKLKNGLKPGPVTPLMFSTTSDTRVLSDLIDRNARVEFDLGGIADHRIWPWLKPEAAWLVWDGEGYSRIRDGRQLFGTYTWGVFWRDGFEALSMLDDNNDGIISGAEATGISIWQDHNCNAVSDPGEVIPLSAAGIKSLACRANDQEDGQPKHSTGVHFINGDEGPLWDWITRPQGEEP